MGRIVKGCIVGRKQEDIAESFGVRMTTNVKFGLMIMYFEFVDVECLSWLESSHPIICLGGRYGCT